MVQASERVTIETDVVFGRGGGRDLRCDVYTPPAHTSPNSARGAPGVLLVHGGGWREGDRKQLSGYGILLGREGFVCVCCEYRLSAEAQWPAQIHDVNAALRWMHANADRLGIDPAHIAIAGASAGGHLALIAAGASGLAAFVGQGGNPGASQALAAAIAFYAPVELGALAAGGSEAVRALMGPAATQAGLDAASPLGYAAPGFPPTLLIHGASDTVVSPGDSVHMYDALRNAGAPVELHMYAGAPHAFDAQREFGRQCAQIMALFLRRYVTGHVRTISQAEAVAAT